MSRNSRSAGKRRTFLLLGLAGLFSLIPVILHSTNAKAEEEHHWTGAPSQADLALEKIETLGGTVFCAGFRDYNARGLTIILGKEWTGGPDDAKLLARVYPIYQLTLDSPRLDASVLDAVCTLGRVEGLIFKSTKPSDSSLRQLQGIRGLQLLQIEGSAITDAGLENLRKQNLAELLLSDCPQITDTGLAHLADMNKMLHLRLSGTAIRGTGFAQLASLKDLRALDLHDTQVDDAALVHVKKFPHLRRLDLSCTRVQGEGLAQLKGLSRLAELNLDGTTLSDEELHYLDGLDHVVVLSLKGTRVTEAGLERLQMKRLQSVLIGGKVIRRGENAARATEMRDAGPDLRKVFY